MKRYGVILLLLASTLLFAQDVAKPAATADSSVADELRQLRQAIEAQQKQIQQQQQELDTLRGQIARTGTSSSAQTGEPQLAETAMRAEVPESAKTADPRVIDAALHNVAAARPEAAQDYDKKADDDSESPLHFRIGKMDFTPGGFLDFAAIVRTTNVGSSIGTSFNSIPYNNTIQGVVSETRFTAQNSRVSLKAHGTWGANDITGYVEADFLGNDAANVFVTSNSHTDRLRLYWVDVKHNKWEFVGGQAWSWLTPSRVGLGPDPKDVFFTLNTDTNYQVGLTWTRAAQFRVAYHPNEHWVFGAAVENPQQYVAAGEVIFPFAFNAMLGTQWDANNNPGVPNLHPDFIPKVAYDTNFAGDRHFHFEVAGLVTSKRVVVVPIGVIPPCDCNLWNHHTATGAGIEFASNVDVFKKFKFLLSGFYGNGGGRYIFGLGPDAVMKPVALASPGQFDVDINLVTAASGIVGFESAITNKTTIAGYYGGAYFDRNAFGDITSPVVVAPHTCETGGPLFTNPCIGFGGTNSPNSANRELQEATFDWIQTLWSDRNYGKLQFITQFSYVTRNPWFVPLGAPRGAHTTMGFVDLRYTLP